MRNARDHGGGLDAAVAEFGGAKDDWIDLSTGINPVPYTFAPPPPHAWAALPDQGAGDALITAARQFWNVPDGAAILPTAGCSSAIALIPLLHPAHRVEIAGPTYNEHAASFAHHGWDVAQTAPDAAARVVVNPNNPTGDFQTPAPAPLLTIIDESFCDIAPNRSLIHRAAEPGHLILKSFGKFWGLAGLRLGFVIGDCALVNALRAKLGPWQVSGPALDIGRQALCDTGWAQTTRAQLAQGAAQLDEYMTRFQAQPMGQVSLFRTYQVDDAQALYQRFARHRVLTRIFPYSNTWIRLGLPHPHDWARLWGIS